MAVLGLRFCARAFSSCGKRGPLFIAGRGPLTITASLVAEYRLQTRRLSNCGSWAQLLRGMWDPPRPGLEPVSLALAGRLSTTAPPGKPHNFFNDIFFLSSAIWFYYSLTIFSPTYHEYFLLCLSFSGLSYCIYYIVLFYYLLQLVGFHLYFQSLSLSSFNRGV